MVLLHPRFLWALGCWILTMLDRAERYMILWRNYLIYYCEKQKTKNVDSCSSLLNLSLLILGSWPVLPLADDSQVLVFTAQYRSLFYYNAELQRNAQLQTCRSDEVMCLDSPRSRTPPFTCCFFGPSTVSSFIEYFISYFPFTFFLFFLGFFHYRM